MVVSLEILKDKKIIITQTELHARMSAACGRSQEPRSYFTTWKSDFEKNLKAHIYISEALKGTEHELLEKLDAYLGICKNEEDLMKLNYSYL